jgi:ATP-dependent RNA helicase SUPV3L1/SUV3
MESFYTFVWAPRARGGENRGPRRPRPEARRHGPQSAAPAPSPAPAQAQEDAAAPATAGDRPERPDRPRTDRPEADGRRKDGPRGRNDGVKGKPRPKGGKPADRDDRPDRPDRPERSDRPRDTQPKVFEARPPREQKVDPDSPFAVLAALRTRI